MFRKHSHNAMLSFLSYPSVDGSLEKNGTVILPDGVV